MFVRELDQLRLLVVEGDDDLRAMLCLHMRWLGHHARFAEDRAAGLQLAGREAFDVLLCSFHLPDGNGGQLLRSLAASGCCPPVAVAMSESCQARDVASSKTAGFALHLAKPFSPEALERSIRLAYKWMRLPNINPRLCVGWQRPRTRWRVSFD